MGLDQFNVAPDNKGGRKPKTDEQEYENPPRKINGAYTKSDDNEDFWQRVYNKHVTSGEPDRKELIKMASKLHILPRTVKQCLTKHEVWEYDEFIDNEPDDESFSFGDSNNEEEDSNLISLVNDTV